MDVGDESILIAVSAPHRRAAWEAGERCLEEAKERVEVWKEEWFEGGGVWRSNRDGGWGVPVIATNGADGGQGEGHGGFEGKGGGARQS